VRDRRRKTPTGAIDVKRRYRRMIDSTGFWLGATVYIVVMAVVVLWAESLGHFQPWMTAVMFITFGLAFAISLSTFLRLRRMDRGEKP
jgi:tellurite resistance protein TehA-like permease